MRSKISFSILALFLALNAFADSDVQCFVNIINSPTSAGIESTASGPSTIPDGFTGIWGWQNYLGSLDVQMNRAGNKVSISIFENRSIGLGPVSKVLVKEGSGSFTDEDILVGGRMFVNLSFVAANYASESSPKQAEAYCYAPVRPLNADINKISDANGKGEMNIGLVNPPVKMSGSHAVE